MKVNFNLNINNTQYKTTSQKQLAVGTSVSFQAAPIKKIQSPEIFGLEKALRPLLFRPKDEFLAKLKEFEHIDINSRNYNGDTIVTKAVKDRSDFLSCLIGMEKRGEIEGVNWNATDANGDNILMISAKTNDLGWTAMKNFGDVIKLAEEGKVDVNYVNKKSGYSLIQCILIYAKNKLYSYLKLKNLDVKQVAKNSSSGSNADSIIKLAMNGAILPYSFEELLCHPTMDMSMCNLEELYHYIDMAPYYESAHTKYWEHNIHYRCPMDRYERDEYKKTLEIGLKVQNAKKIAQYYEENGMLTLDQIERHVKNVDCERAINYPLNNINETIAHFLAETYVSPNDTLGVRKVKDIINNMRQSICYFWQEDAIGRSPLMLALEYENFVVARAMLERMVDSEIKYCDLNERGCLPCCAIKSSKMDHVGPLLELISGLEPSKRREFEELLYQRLNTKYGW